MRKKNHAKRTPAGAPPWSPDSFRYPESLPIAKRRAEIVEAIRRHPVIILSGETGSGKTTQIPKMCLEAERGRRQRIACTQPRRVAALSIGKRVAEELNVEYGREVGSKIRFSDKTSRETRIKFLTDGMLLSEIQSDSDMREYDTVIVDEAHERSLNIDFLMGHLNQLRKRRADLRIIITSATIDVEKFSRAFDEAPIIEVSGRVYPVDVLYAPPDEWQPDSGDLTLAEGIAEAAERIIDEFGQGDILAFLPTEKDILEARDLLEGRLGNAAAILPCFGRLSHADQQRIFSPSPVRKIVLATNIAETSLTIPGIRFVIDTGLARTSRYNPRARIKRLPIEKVSQSSANQRSGRCGRVADGICIRLYSESDFDKRPAFSIPEIQRCNLAEVILRMKASELGDIETFPFIDRPNPAAIKSGYALLEELGAMEGDRKLTSIGRKLARLPIDPTAGRMLLQAEREGVVEQMLVIVSALSIPDPRELPMGKETAARAAHKKFAHRESDFLALLNIWETAPKGLEGLSQSQLRKFCRKHFLSYTRLREWIDVKRQLSRSLMEFERFQRLQRQRQWPNYGSEKEKLESRKYGGSEYRSIHLCLATGLLANPGRKEEPNIYRAAGDRKAMVFPGSGLFHRKASSTKNRDGNHQPQPSTKNPGPNWILAGEIVETSRLYARTVAAIDPSWIVQIGGNAIKRSYTQPNFDADQGRVTCLESIRIHGLELQRKTISYGRINPQEATEIFIREALLNEDFPIPQPFIEANRRLKNRIQNAQTTVRMRSWIGIEEAAFRFYESRLENVASLGDLRRWLKTNGERAEESLRMSEKHLLPDGESPLHLSAFPEQAQLENTALPIDYQYKPGNEDDGVTLKVPYSEALSIDDCALDWLVPGHFEAKVLHLLRALPKRRRRQLHPLRQTAAKIARHLEPGKRRFRESLRQRLKTEFGIETYESDWDEDAIPSHLRVRMQVQDSEGATILEGRSASSIHKAIEEQARSATSLRDESGLESLWREARKRWEKPIRGSVDLPALPEQMPIGALSGVPVHAFPAILIRSGQPRLALLDSLDQARAANRQGIAAVMEIELGRELAWIQKDLDDLSKLGPILAAFAPVEEVKRQAFERIRRDLCDHGVESIDTTRIHELITKSKSKSRGLAYRLIDQIDAILRSRQTLKADQGLPQFLKAEVDRIVSRDFLLRSPDWAIGRIPVYLKAIKVRQAAREKDPLRDQSRQAEISSLRERLRNLEAPSKAKEEIDWMIEEYALSLFAQSLGAAFPVSAKRIDAKFQEADEANSRVRPRADPPADRPTSDDLQSLKSHFR